MEYLHEWTVTDLKCVGDNKTYIFNREAYKFLTLENFSEFVDTIKNGSYYNNYPENLKVLAHFVRFQSAEWVRITKNLEEIKFFEDTNIPEKVKTCLLSMTDSLSSVIGNMNGMVYIKVVPTIIGNISFSLKQIHGEYATRLFTFTGVTEYTTSRNIKIAGAMREGIQTAKLSIEPFFYRNFIFSEGHIEKGVVSAAPSCATISPEEFVITIRGRHTDKKFKDCWATLNMKFSAKENDNILIRFNSLTNFVHLAYREESISSITEPIQFKFNSANILLQKPVDEQELPIDYFDDIHRIITDSDKAHHHIFPDYGPNDHPGEDIFTVNTWVGNKNEYHCDIVFPTLTETFTLFTQVPKL